MIIIPQRLFGEKNVHTILRNGNVCILSKELNQAIINREGYISNHVISILLAGEQHIKPHEAATIKIKAGEVLFIPRGMYHITDLLPKEGTFKSLLFYFDDPIIQEFLSNTKLTELSTTAVPNHLKFGSIPSIDHFANALLHIYSNQRLKDPSFLKIKILELLYLLNGLAKEQEFASFLFRLTLPKKRNIKNFMEQNFDKPLKIEDYAYLTGRSLSTFRRDFKAFFQITPQKWIKKKRLEKAVQLIEQKQLSVTELAYEVGYENISYFIKEFKNKIGQSPKQYILHRSQNSLN